jgi:hypothetical protein
MKRIINNKGGFEMSFAMIFSILAGAVIIFLAIYATTRLVSTNQYQSYSESALTISNLLNPIVNDITLASKAPEIDFKKETRIYLGCETTVPSSPIFGRQTLAFSEESGLIKKWSEPGANISRNNKYIFGESMQQGKVLNLFSKPFYVSYRVDDLVFLTLSDYCFVAPPEMIKDEIENLKIKNINITPQVSKCPKNAIKVCFGISAGCNITVYGSGNDYSSGRVTKNGKNLEYVGGLIYGAIFASPQIYECNIKRLGVKTSKLAQVYKEKIDIVKSEGCNSLIEGNLNNIISLSDNLSSSKLSNLFNEARNMDLVNQRANCQMYRGQDY